MINNAENSVSDDSKILNIMSPKNRKSQIHTSYVPRRESMSPAGNIFIVRVV